MRPKKKSSKRGGKKPVFKPQPKGQGSSGRITSLLLDAKEQMEVGKYGRASAALKKVLAIEEGHPEALRIFATLHLKLGSLMAAKTSFEALARKAMKSKDYRLAESLLREYLAVAPRYVPFLELLGQALEANGHFMAAVAEYGKAIEIFVEADDPELSTKGAELFDLMKVIGADSALTKKLATHFPEAFPVLENASVLDTVLSEQDDVEGEAIPPDAPSPFVDHRSEDVGAPAPFPWAPTDEAEPSSLAEGGVVDESHSQVLGEEQDRLTLPESLRQEVASSPEESMLSSEFEEPEGQGEDEITAAPSSLSESLSDTSALDVHTDESSPGQDQLVSGKEEIPIDPLPWEEVGLVESVAADVSPVSSMSTDELSPQGESAGESFVEMEGGHQGDQAPDQTEERLLPPISTPFSWEMPSTSSDAAVAPLPWEDSFDPSSPDADSSQVSDSKLEKSCDPSQSDEVRTESDSTNQSLSFNAVDKDASSFAPFPWEGHAESPDIAIPDVMLPTEEDELDSLSSRNGREEEGSMLHDLLPAALDAEVPDDVAGKAVDEVESSHALLEEEIFLSEGQPQPDEVRGQEAGLPSPEMSEDLHAAEESVPDFEEVVSLTESPAIVEAQAKSPEDFKADLSETSGNEEVSDGLDAILDGSYETHGSFLEPETEEEVEAKPLEEVAAEAMAALQGEPETSIVAVPASESSFSPFGQSGTVELKDLPEEQGIQAEEEESLAEAATEALTAFEDGFETPVLSPEESQVPPAISHNIDGANDLQFETSVSEEPLAEPLEESSPVLEESSLLATVERTEEFEAFAEEEPEASYLPVDQARRDLAEDLPTPLELDVSPTQAESRTWEIAADVQPEDERVEQSFASEGEVHILEPEEAQIPEEQEEAPDREEEKQEEPEPTEEMVVAESVVEEVPVPLSPWDPQEDTEQASSVHDKFVDENSDVEASVEEPSGIPASIQFVQSETSREADEVPRSAAPSFLETTRPDAPTGAGIDIVYPEAAPSSFQEEEEMAEELREAERLPVARSSGPMWAVAQSQGGQSGEVKHKPLFPTANKVKYKVKRFTQGVISTVRTVSILTLLVSAGVGLLGFVTVGILSMIWVAVEERPNEPFQNMMKGPTLSRLDFNRNGYDVLKQMGVTSTLYPIGFPEEAQQGADAPDNQEGPDGNSEVFTALAGWFQLSDPIAEFQAQASQLRSWSSRYGAELSKYHQWNGKSFEDRGYRSLEGPREKQVISVHRLFIAEGFSGTMKQGVDRLANDLEAWRFALGEAKTLRIKMLALEVIKDDLVILSALLGNPYLDQSFLPTLTQLGRPISQLERSLRWPMQNQFALEVDQIKTYMNSQRFPDRPFYQKAMTYLPLPEQKILNAHAAFYEKLVSHDATLHLEGDPRKGLPSRYSLAHTPAESLSDYFNNPVDNLVMTQRKVDWRSMTGRLIELEARLRLTTLQARIRRPPDTRDPISRIAQAGQGYFDPFTGYTMLFNASKTRLYSVGIDGVDNDGDLEHDVAVPLFPR